MSIVKEKSPKPSTKLHAGMHITPKVNHKRVQPRSMEQLAEEFCEEMIQNIRPKFQIVLDGNMLINK